MLAFGWRWLNTLDMLLFLRAESLELRAKVQEPTRVAVWWAENEPV